MAFLSYKKPGGELVEKKLSGAEITIGRASECTFPLGHDTEASRVHCTLHREPDGSYLVIDSASRNGTFVNGERVLNDGVPLRADDVIRVGRTRLHCRDTSAYDASSAIREAEKDLEHGVGLGDALREIVEKHGRPPGRQMSADSDANTSPEG